MIKKLYHGQLFFLFEILVYNKISNYLKMRMTDFLRCGPSFLDINQILLFDLELVEI